jgi:hypothetical protein
MPRFDFPKQPPPTPVDVTFANGWLVDIFALQGQTETIIYRDCALTTLARASQLFEDLARQVCSKPLAYGEETRTKYVLPRGVAGAAFIRILDWIRACHEIMGHGEIEDPQISTFDDDGLTQYLRLLQAANLLELKSPYHNQKRLPDMIKANIKKGFDTKNNTFQKVSITDHEIALIWDFGKGNREDSIVKLMLALFVDAYDARKDHPHKYKDNVRARFDALIGKNDLFRSAVVDVKTKKDVRLREEERERKVLPKVHVSHRRRGDRGSGQRKSWMHGGPVKKTSPKVATFDEAEQWRGHELTENQVDALMSRPEEFRIMYGNGAAKYADRYYDQAHER